MYNGGGGGRLILVLLTDCLKHSERKYVDKYINEVGPEPESVIVSKCQCVNIKSFVCLS